MFSRQIMDEPPSCGSLMSRTCWSMYTKFLPMRDLMSSRSLWLTLVAGTVIYFNAFMNMWRTTLHGGRRGTNCFSWIGCLDLTISTSMLCTPTVCPRLSFVLGKYGFYFHLYSVQPRNMGPLVICIGDYSVLPTIVVMIIAHGKEAS